MALKCYNFLYLSEGSIPIVQQVLQSMVTTMKCSNIGKEIQLLETGSTVHDLLTVIYHCVRYLPLIACSVYGLDSLAFRSA